MDVPDPRIKKWSPEWFDLKKQRLKAEVELIKAETNATILFIETEKLGLKIIDLFRIKL